MLGAGLIDLFCGCLGHVKISDLGLTIKLRKNKILKHLAGTAGYWAPEIVAKQGMRGGRALLLLCSA
jgi:hypothetical protein